MPIKTLIVDDEEPARDRLKNLLQPHRDIEVTGEAGDGVEALERISELKPDLIFMDIQMPGCDGLEVVQSLVSPRPAIVFCTAFDQYAVDAFELNAVDYLLKPVSRARLARALERVKGATPAETELKAVKASRALKKAPERFLAKRGAKFRVISKHEVLYFASQEGLTKLCSRENREYWIQPSLTDLEKRLNSSEFFRVSRAVIVNLRAVREVVPLIGGHGQVVLSSGAAVDVSRRRYKPLLEKLQG